MLTRVRHTESSDQKTGRGAIGRDKAPSLEMPNTYLTPHHSDSDVMHSILKAITFLENHVSFLIFFKAVGQI